MPSDLKAATIGSAGIRAGCSAAKPPGADAGVISREWAVPSTLRISRRAASDDPERAGRRHPLALSALAAETREQVDVRPSVVKDAGHFLVRPTEEPSAYDIVRIGEGVAGHFDGTLDTRRP